MILTGCGRTPQNHPHGVNVMEESELIAIYDREGYDEVYIVSPKGDEVAHYVLVESDSIMDFPEGAEIIRVPVESMVIDSEVYAGALEELGAANLITGLFDARYITSSDLQKRLQGRQIQDVGQTSSPNSERILKMQPGAIVISYFDGMQTREIDKLEIPIIKMYDLQEASPLARAEWIKFLGRLSGKAEKADSIFTEVKGDYNSIRRQKKDSIAPKVLTEIIYEGVWNVAGGHSYQSALIKDAGGRYFKADDESAVNLNLAPEQVLLEGGDADVWLIRYFGDARALRQILDSDPLYGELKAYKNGNIYFSDTSRSGLFREFPFHPERLLEDYTVIFSGDSVTPMRYFEKLK